MYPMSRKDLSRLVGKTIQFTEKILDSEIAFEPGMIGVIVEAEHHLHGNGSDDDGCFKLKVAFGGMYLEHNEKLMSANYYDSNHNPTLKWNQTKYYPKDHVSTDYYTYGTWHERHKEEHEFKFLDMEARNPDQSVSLIDTISVNVDNEKMTDAEFRQFIRNSLPLTLGKG